MPRTGRPPLTEAHVQERIQAYCARYDAKLNAEGFPVFPAGRRETRQHREWMTLYRAFQRVRKRATPADDASAAVCPVCLQPSDRAGRIHRRCGRVVEFVRDLGPAGLERIRDQAFPDDSGAVVGVEEPGQD